jgi:hypothetical protein
MCVRERKQESESERVLSEPLRPQLGGSINSRQLWQRWPKSLVGQKQGTHTQPAAG